MYFFFHTNPHLTFLYQGPLGTASTKKLVLLQDIKSIQAFPCPVGCWLRHQPTEAASPCLYRSQFEHQEGGWAGWLSADAWLTVPKNHIKPEKGLSRCAESDFYSLLVAVLFLTPCQHSIPQAWGLSVCGKSRGSTQKMCVFSAPSLTDLDLFILNIQPGSCNYCFLCLIHFI